MAYPTTCRGSLEQPRPHRQLCEFSGISGLPSTRSESLIHHHIDDDRSPPPFHARPSHQPEIITPRLRRAGSRAQGPMMLPGVSPPSIEYPISSSTGPESRLPGSHLADRIQCASEPMGRTSIQGESRTCCANIGPRAPKAANRAEYEWVRCHTVHYALGGNNNEKPAPSLPRPRSRQGRVAFC
jgi:hypothetical protein